MAVTASLTVSRLSGWTGSQEWNAKHNFKTDINLEVHAVSTEQKQISGRAETNCVSA